MKSHQQLQDEQIASSAPVLADPAQGNAPAASRDLAFKNFGVLDAGQQTRSSVATSLLVNGAALLLVLLVSLTAKKIIKPVTVTTLTAPIPVKPPEEPKPLPPTPKFPKPPVVKVEVPPPPPDVPKIEVPEPPKVQPVVTKAAPTPAPPNPAPKAVTPPPAPHPVAINIAQAASVANNDPHPAAIRLGSMSNPVNNTAGPAVSPVNLGRSGAPGMPSGNTGLGAPSKIAINGSGSPNGTMGGRDNGPQPVKGISLGAAGATGPTTARPVGAIQIARNTPAPTIPVAQPTATPAKIAPKLLFKPRPEYTDEARQMHLEGTVYVKIHVAASGSVSVVGVQSGLGHGLDQSAVRAVQSMRFQPALQNGQPADWDGVVNIIFQLAG
ncbi:MAG: energy transducer TonB [Janthinobacterium lividum]